MSRKDRRGEASRARRGLSSPAPTKDGARSPWRKLTAAPERIPSAGEMEMPCECCEGKIFLPAVEDRTANYVVHTSPACETFLSLDPVEFMRETNKRLRIKQATKNGIFLA